MIVSGLTVYAHDHAALTSWQRTWQDAASMVRQIWPRPDAFDDAEALQRERIARTGAAGRRRTR